MLPFLVVFALVLVAPVVYAIYLSLFQEQMIGGNSFVGADNYVRALTDPNFWDSLGRVVLFLVVQVPIMLIVALAANEMVSASHGFGPPPVCSTASSTVQVTSLILTSPTTAQRLPPRGLTRVLRNEIVG